jgi:hypothetical protein
MKAARTMATERPQQYSTALGSDNPTWHHRDTSPQRGHQKGGWSVLPGFNASGVMPPFIGADPGMNSSLSSPYEATMSGFVGQFGQSAPRREILRRLLSYRKSLRDLGITTGFQMFDGSFIEDCERLRSRPPSDLDVVTFSHLPVLPHQVQDFVQQNIALFDPVTVKSSYLLDSFFVDLTRDARYVVAETMYWYGLFSHQRETFMWKGLVTVPMMSDDAHALAAIDAAEAADAQEA